MFIEVKKQQLNKNEQKRFALFSNINSKSSIKKNFDLTLNYRFSNEKNVLNL